MTIGIYGIFDGETDECLYVGMSKNIEERWKQHIKLLRNKKHPRKDFVERFHALGAVEKLLSFKILEECECDESVLNLAEIKWFNELKPKYYGKKPSLNEKWEHSEETKRKIGMACSEKEPWNKKNKDTLSPASYDFLCLGCGKKVKCIKPQQKFCSKTCVHEKKAREKAEEYDYEYIYDLYWNQRLSRPELAKKLGVGRTTALKIMKRLGIPRRNADEGLKNSIERNEKYSEELSKRLKNLSKEVCQYCDKEFSPMAIKRHETSCQTYPSCSHCGIKLKKKTSKTCQKHQNE